jgi:hypothetical protein
VLAQFGKKTEGFTKSASVIILQEYSKCENGALILKQL